MLRTFASQPPDIEAERIAFLDGLRGLAVLAVVVFHAAKLVPAINHSTSTGTAVLQQLCHGVDLFFILSGFCLAYPALKKLRSSKELDFDLAGYGARRLVRIVPPYYAAIGLFCAVLFFKSLNQMGGYAIPDTSVYDIVRQAFFIDANVHLLNISFWSLAVEFRWYFVFPVFLWLWVRSPRAFFVAGAGICLAALLTRAQSLDLLFLPTFLLGIVAAAAFVEKRIARIWLLWLLLFAALAFLKSRNDGWSWSTNPLWGIAMFWLVIGVAGTRQVNAAISHPWLTKIGYSSYAIYLTHEPVLRFVAARVAFLTTPWVLFSVITFAALLFGLTFSFVAERPFTQGKLRTFLVDVLERNLARCLTRINCSAQLPLAAAPSGDARANAA